LSSLDDKIDPATDGARLIGGVAMVLWQTALGLAILFVWQGVSGRLVDNQYAEFGHDRTSLSSHWLVTRLACDHSTRIFVPKPA